MSKITKAELADLAASRSEKDWNAVCDRIKASRDGKYPEDWWAEVMQSGLCASVSARWNGTDQVQIRPMSASKSRAFFGSPRGFTFVEMMIVIIIVGVFVSILGVGCSSCLYADEARKRADSDALNYIRELHPDWTDVHAVCQSTDSDHDGYVSCTVAAKDSAGSPRDLPLECRHSVFFNYSRGCRPVRAIINTRGVGYDQR